MKEAIWDLAAKQGPRPEVIQRDLDKLHGMGKFVGESVPSSRKIKAVIEVLNELDITVLSTLPPRVWSLREDFHQIKPKLEELGRIQSEGLDIDKVLQSLGPERWKQIAYLHEVMKWSEDQIGERLGVGIREVRVDLEKAERERHSEKVALEPFAQRWLGELPVPSPAQLLRRELGKLSQETARRQAIGEDTKRLYYQSALPHLGSGEGVRIVPVPLEGDPLYHKLRREFPASAAWPAYRSWQEQYDVYIRVFAHWFTGIDSLLMLLREEFEEVMDDAHLLRSIWLMNFCLACDLLAQGIEESTPDVRWVYLLAQLRELRADVCVVFSSLKGEPQPRDWSTDANTIWADAEDRAGLVKDTKTLLDELYKLWLAEGRLVAALQELEAEALSSGR
jgi:hypothetical protein